MASYSRMAASGVLAVRARSRSWAQPNWVPTCAWAGSSASSRRPAGNSGLPLLAGAACTRDGSRRSMRSPPAGVLVVATMVLRLICSARWRASLTRVVLIGWVRRYSGTE